MLRRSLSVPSERSIIRVSLFVGFGLVFALWAASAYDVGRNMWIVQGQTVGFHQWLADTEMLLDEVRTGVLEASVDVRDALLDASRSDDSYRRRLDDARRLVESALHRYEPYVHSDGEHRDLAELRHMVADLWEATEPILALDERGLQGEALDSLRHQILPRRQAIQQMSERIARLNEGAAADQRAAVVTAFRSAERRAWFLGALTFLLTLVVALVVTRHADRMERQIRRETAKNAEHAKALQRLSDQLVRAGEVERRTIARELHDEIGQALTAVKMDLTRTAAAVASHSSELESARAGVDAAIETVRTLSRMLHPTVLEDLGLAAAVEWHLRQFAKRSGIEASFTHAGLDARLPPSVEASIYRTIQEATNNIVRHADATRCSVAIEHSAGRITAVVEDNGCGIDPMQAAAPRGLGLISIRERIGGLGGTVDLAGQPGLGTRLRVEIPAPGGGSERRDGDSPVSNRSAAVVFSN
jgi:signal transduction histidine kinase